MSSFYGNGGYSSGGGGGSGEVISVNGKKGRVTLDAADVHALPDSTQIPSLEGFATEAWVQEQGYTTLADIPSVPTNVSAFTNDAGYLTQHQDISSKANKTEIIPKPASAGTEGQVLTIDANGNPKWDNTSFVKVTDDGQGNVSMETLYGVLIDAAPAQNSNNLVTSGGIYNAINAVSGSDGYFITATYDNNENTFVINKTFAEINTAISNGKIPILIAEGQAWYWLYDKAPTYLRFICIGGNNTNNYIHIQSNGNVTFSTISSANPTNYYTKTEIDNKIGNIETLLAQI